MSDYETVKAGKTTLTITPGGTLRFTDTRGIERTIEDPHLATRLFETVRDGSGKPTTIARVEGTEPANNLFSGNRPVKQIPAEAVERKPQTPKPLMIP